jgi:hypothetical protein
MGHPGICCTFCRGQEMPRFIPRGSATPVDDCKESRMRFVDPPSLTGNPGGWGTRELLPGKATECSHHRPRYTGANLKIHRLA